MNLLDYQRLALRTEKLLPTPFDRMVHAALGLITETGEFTTEVKRYAIYEKPLDEARRAHMAEELGDALWYAAIAADVIGLQLADLAPTARPMAVPVRMVSIRFASLVGRMTDALDADGLSRDAIGIISISLHNLLEGVVIACSHIGVPLAEICQANIDKLRERFPDAYSNEAAEARADKGGADARNS